MSGNKKLANDLSRTFLEHMSKSKKSLDFYRDTGNLYQKHDMNKHLNKFLKLMLIEIKINYENFLKSFFRFIRNMESRPEVPFKEGVLEFEEYLSIRKCEPDEEFTYRLELGEEIKLRIEVFSSLFRGLVTKPTYWACSEY